MDQLHMLRAFVAAAQYRSFSKAADALGVSCGAVSKAIARLEQHTHTRLLHRTTRSVVLTEEAQYYYCSCRRLLEELDEANHQITRGGERTGGRLRLVVHSMLIGDAFAQLVSSFSAAHPGVNVVVSLHDSLVDMFDGQYDMALVPHNHVEQSAAIRRTLARSKKIFVAAPEYLSRHGSPVEAADLRKHVLLLDPKLRQKGTDYVTVVEDGRLVNVAPSSSLDGSEAMLRSAVLAGHGIAMLPEVMVRDDLARGRLTHVLPACSTAEHETELCLFYTNRAYLPVRFRSFIDFCIDFFRLDPMSASAPRDMRLSLNTSAPTIRTAPHEPRWQDSIDGLAGQT
jgi:DNA-binding transcriptional LysR family regulator